MGNLLHEVVGRFKTPCDDLIATLIMIARIQGRLECSVDLLERAEMNFKAAWSVAKLMRPDEQHVAIVTGLSDALYGLGRATDAKDVLRSAGLARQNMQQDMPGSYKK